MTKKDDKNSGDQDKSKEDDKKSAVDAEKFNQLVSTVSNLAESLHSLQTSVSAINERSTNTSKDSEEDDKDDLEGIDLETLSRADNNKLILGMMGKELDKRINDIVEKLNGVDNKVETKSLNDTVKELARENKDFWDFKSEIAAIAKETPGISIVDAYDLAKVRNPEKVAELAEKYKEETSGDTDDKGSNFGGLTPTSGQTAKTTNMSKDEASEAAWQEAMSDIPAELLTGEIV